MRSEIARSIRHQGDLFRLHFQHQINEFLRRIALDIELGLDQGTERENVIVFYMTLIGSGMHSYALRPESLAIASEFLHIGDILAACIAQRSHFVDINTQLSHCLNF